MKPDSRISNSWNPGTGTNAGLTSTPTTHKPISPYHIQHSLYLYINIYCLWQTNLQNDLHKSFKVSITKYDLIPGYWFTGGDSVLLM